jgi:ribose-phosphate pyrophosphokinase
MAAAVHAFPEGAAQGAALAAALGIGFAPVGLHQFPDGESLVQVNPARASGCALLFRSLDHPNAKLIELLLAAAALRDNGADRVILIAPYLGYMRQDTAFAPGQAVSQRVVGKLLAGHFDAVLTVDPHLHRSAALDQVMPGIAAVSISAAPVLDAAIAGYRDTVLAGPDAESRPWVEAIARPLGLPVLVGTKLRHGDRAVAVTFDTPDQVRGRHAVLVDDVISSGTTLVRAAQALLVAGARSVEVLATHCLASENDIAHMTAAGIARIRATDSVSGPCASLALAGLLAAAIRERGWMEGEMPWPTSS